MDYEPKSDGLDCSRPQSKSARVEPKLEPTWRPRTAMDSDGESAHRSDFAANAAACRQYGGTMKQPPPRGQEDFSTFEHMEYGNEGARAAGVEGNYRIGALVLTHGDIVALTGDYFDPRETDDKGRPNADNLFVLASRKSDAPGKRVGTQDEVIYALYDGNKEDPRFKRGGEFWGIEFSKEVEAVVINRYLWRASTNFEHFVNPRGPGSGGPTSANGSSAGGSYRALHEDAIRRAHAAKKAGQPIDDALKHEAAAEHYLTDGFASGHIRTPRESIQDYWKAKYPLFFENFKKTVAQDVAIHIRENQLGWKKHFCTIAEITKPILDKINTETKSLPPIGLEAIVAPVTHDFDNAQGLWVKNDLGQTWRTFGDSHGGVPNPKSATEDEEKKQERERLAAQKDTRLHVEEAVKLSILDVKHAYDAPVQATEEDIFNLVRSRTATPAVAGQPKFGAEQLMPFPDPDKKATNGTQQWKQPDFKTLWSTRVRSDNSITYGMLIRASASAGDINVQVTGIADKFPADFNVEGKNVVLHPRQAYEMSFLPALITDPYPTIQRIIDYNPGRAAGNRADIATMEDLDHLEVHDKTDHAGPNLAESQRSGIEGLTFAQRVQYIKNLQSGGGRGDRESSRIYDIFRTALPADRRKLYEALEGHPWTGAFRHGWAVSDDNLWNNLNKDTMIALEKLLNASP